jgi:hypothetical protein
VPRTWAKVGPPAAVADITVIEQSDGTDMLEAVIVESAAEPEGAPPDQQWQIRMNNPERKQGEPDYVDLPWMFDSAAEAEAAIKDWQGGPIGPDVHRKKTQQGPHAD